MCHAFDKKIRRGLKPIPDDARYQGKVHVYYPCHPLFRKPNLSIRRRLGMAGVEYLEIQSADGRQCVPAWMVDADRCARMTCGLHPAVDFPSLMELVDLLNTLDL